MNANTIIEVKKKYQEDPDKWVSLSLALILEGASANEVFLLKKAWDEELKLIKK